ncbi:hypothetical protein HDU76_008943 [Blyttiomyces sp. JEL0837]|nr:hypothetical protein HDU76_008943 [Blyttiomyces sp. JEL0837]
MSINGLTGPWSRKFTLVVDPAIAKPSLESPLISIKTVVRLEIILDTSFHGNITSHSRSAWLFEQAQQFNNNTEANLDDSNTSIMPARPQQMQGLDPQQRQHLQTSGANLNRSTSEIVHGNIGVHQKVQKGYTEGYRKHQQEGHYYNPTPNGTSPMRQHQQEGQYHNPTPNAKPPIRHASLAGNNTPPATNTTQLHPSQLQE